MGGEVEARDLLRHDDGIPLDHEADARAHLQLRRDGRRSGERDERVERVGIISRKLTAARERGTPARRDVSVLRHPERLEAAVLHRARQLVDPDRVVGVEDTHADVHGSLLFDSGRILYSRLEARHGPAAWRSAPRTAPAGWSV